MGDTCTPCANDSNCTNALCVVDPDTISYCGAADPGCGASCSPGYTCVLMSDVAGGNAHHVCYPTSGSCSVPVGDSCTNCARDSDCSQTLPEACLNFGKCEYICTTNAECPVGYTCQASTDIGTNSVMACHKSGGCTSGGTGTTGG